jgi:diguanylate cyclase (GGDEF)-like protein
VAKQGAALLVENLADEKALPTSPARSYFTNSLLSVPIRHGSRVLGVLNLTDKSDGSSFTETERELVLALARQAGAFIENARLLKKMETLSIVDELTGLYNRRFFEQCLENETIRARRYKRFLTLALLDIDDFKRFNDTHGYLKGDELLRGVARILRKSFRKTDIVTRWGGEEFAILLPETEKPDPGRPSPALHFTERVRLAIAGETFAAASMTTTQITVSGGVATFPTDTSDKSDLLAKANAALKQAKTSGKNRVCVFGEEKIA